ncbi:MAG: TIGR04372 family glycosyltransferase [Candidatus Omnitrophica bacterium]|nr:TIGR04372 family glycosyltransferase [Candidatus Omnitrophota bacterium]
MIRFHDINSDRIGHFSGNMEVYLSQRDAGMHQRRVIDIFYRDKIVCNVQLMEMWARVIPIPRPYALWRRLAWANRKLPGGKAHEYKDGRYYDTYGVLEKTKPHLLFTGEEEKRGQEALWAMGIPEGKPFVCFIVRDKAYLSALMKGQDFSYHDYRDTNIEKYRLAMEGLSQRGYGSVRMGAAVKNKLRFSCPGLIDYAANGMRDDFRDVYLTAKCSFFIFSESGLGVLAMAFRRPVVCLDLVPMRLAHAWGSDYVLTFRKLWLKSEKRFLRFREIVHSEIGMYLHTRQYQESGIELIENTAEEVRDAIEETAARCEGRWETNEEYEDLQRRFWSFYADSSELRVLRARVGSKFLLQNKDLL